MGKEFRLEMQVGDGLDTRSKPNPFSRFKPGPYAIYVGTDGQTLRGKDREAYIRALRNRDKIQKLQVEISDLESGERNF